MSRPARFRWLRRTATGVLVLLVSLVLLLAWLLATPSGARFAIARLPGVLPGDLSIGRIDGTLLGTLTIEGVDYAIGETRVAIGRLDARVAPGVLWNFRRLTVESLTLAGVSVTYPAPAPDPAPQGGTGGAEPIIVPAFAMPSLPMTITVESFDASDIAFGAAGAAPRRIDSIALAGRVAGTAIRLDGLDVAAPAGRLGLAGDIDLGRSLALDVSADWALADASKSAGSLRVAGDRGGYDVEHELAAPFVVDSTGRVSMPPGEPLRVELRHRAEQIVLQAGARRIAFADATVSTVGRYTDWRAEGEATVDVADAGSGSVDFAARGSALQVTVDNVTLRPETGGRLVANGSLDTADDLAWQARVDAEDLDLALAGTGLDGSLSVALDGDGRFGGAPRADVRIERLGGRLGDTALGASGGVGWRPGVILLDAFGASVGPNTARADGRIGLDSDVDLSLDIDAPELQALTPRLAGSVTAGGRLSGPIRMPAIDFRVESPALVFDLLEIADLTARIDTDARGERFDLSVRAGAVSRGAASASLVTLASSGSLAAHTITLELASERVPSVRVDAEGGYADGVWRGRVGRADVSADVPEGTEDFSLQAPFALTAGAQTIDVSRACWTASGNLSACAAVTLDDTRIDASASVTGVALGRWLVPPPLGLDWSGTAALTVDVDGSRDAPDGSAALDIEGLTVTRRTGDEATTVAFDVARAEAELAAGALDTRAELTIAGGGDIGAELALADLYSGQSALTGSLTVALPDVTAVNALFDKVRFSEGGLRAEANLSGTRESPAVDMRVDASAIRARLLPLGIEITDVRVAAESADGRTLRFSGGGRSGEGRFDLDGQTSLAGPEAFATKATVTAERFTFLDLPDRLAVASMDIELAAEPGRQSLSGTLTVDRANITVQGLPENAVRVSSDAVVVGDAAGGAPPTGPEQTIDVTVRLSEDVRLQAFGLRTALDGALQLRKRPEASLQGYGVLELRDAAYTAYGQSLEVTRGQLTFNGPLEAPELDVRAEREVADKRVGIEITGTPQSLSSELYSEPALPEAEAFSLLLTGRSLASSGEGDAALADVAITLGLRRAFSVGSAVRDAFGLDTLTVAGSGSDGRVLAGKQISPRIYLEYAYGVFDQVSRVLLRLQLSDRLALETVSGDQQSVDLVYTVGSP